MKLAGRLLINCPVSGQKEYSGPLAQLVEHLTLNQAVAGSIPARLTNHVAKVGGYPLLYDQSDRAWPAGPFFCPFRLFPPYHKAEVTA